MDLIGSKVVECYFVLEPDVPKDSSTEVTCIMKALDHAAAILKSRGCPMPPHLIIEAFLPKGLKHIVWHGSQPVEICYS